MTLINYLLWSGCGIALFFIIDILILKYSNWLKFQRWYYIAAILISLLIPLLSVFIEPTEELISQMSLPQVTIEYQAPSPVYTSEEVLQEGSNPHGFGSFTWWISALQVIWIVGALLTAIKQLIGWLSIRRITRQSEKLELDGAYLYLWDNKVTPFTFLNRIIISKSLMNTPIFDSIIRHEMEHVHQAHYRDLLLGVLLQLLQWWNPFAWSLLHRQRNTLEYLADQGVICSGAIKKEYQMHLLQGATGRILELPLLSFSVHNIKRRIIMMNNQKKRNRWVSLLSALSALAVVPMLALGSQLVHATPSSTDFVTQQNSSEEPPVQNEPPKNDSDEHVYEYLEHFPSFHGGDKALTEWLKENMNYPKEAQEKSIQGKIYVSFIVEKDGSISDTKIVRSIDPLLDAEAIRIIKTMPKWEPGKNDKGDPARCRFTQPIVFRIDDAQRNTEKAEKPKETTEKESEGTPIKFGKIPSFPGGDKTLDEWIGKNIKYPPEAQKDKIQGKVYVSFFVEKDGSISNAEVVKGAHPQLDEEAIRLVNSMPKWNPATTEEGEEIRCSMTLPVLFKL